MKRTVLSLGLLFTCACGVDGADQDDVSAVNGSIYFDDAYGIDGSGNRCWTNGGAQGWAGGTCQAPDSKSWTVILPSNSVVASARHGCGTDTLATDFYAAAQTAASEWRFQLNTRAGHGWNVDAQTTFLQQPVSHKFQLDCVRGSVGPTTYGVTTLPASCSGSLVCNTDPRGFGKFERYKAVDGMHMYLDRIASISGWSTATQTQRRNLMTSMVLHELMHVAGLGHDTCAESPLMGMGACRNFDFSKIIVPTDFEISMLQRYNPSSSNPNPL